VVFYSTIFNNIANFSSTIFNNMADFISTTFNKKADFSEATFKGNADFRGMGVEEMLIFDKMTWEGRVDLRGMSTKELRWDSTQKPSEVKGVVDLREATIGSAIFNEVHFQDVVDFSRTSFCLEIFGPLTKGQLEVGQRSLCHPSTLVHLENNTFEKEADFLH